MALLPLLKNRPFFTHRLFRFPAKMKASAEKVGKGLIINMDRKGFAISPSKGDALSFMLCRLFPIKTNRLMAKVVASAGLYAK